MDTLTRRSILCNSLALGAAGTLARPYVANASATTINVRWTQGFCSDIRRLARAAVSSTAAGLADNSPPDSLASPISRLSKVFRPYCTFYVSLIAVAFQHEVGDAPDVDFRDHVDRLSGEHLCTVNPTVGGAKLSVSLAVSAVRSPLVVHCARGKGG
jgi:hypothetical protein